jgi:hypothetical protein
MPQTKTAKLKKLQRQVNEKLKNLVIPAGEDRKEYIAKTLAPLQLYTYYGIISAIGGTSTGNQVSFQTGNTGYESEWPIWAYNLALLAFSSGKQIYVASSNQSAFGNYLVLVDVFA